nr:NADH dehydrogenase subunit 2 [Lamproglena orientalis]WKB11716.1 NADH dehydrogenase subunit 2 [Lamproglena orientalis]
MMSWKNLFFTSLLILSILAGLSSKNLITLWVFMELNMVSFMGMIMTSYETDKNISNNYNLLLVYFLIQAPASIMILIMLMLEEFMNTNIIINGLLFLKLGSSPLHFWYVYMMEMSPFPILWILTTMQKILPLTFLLYIYSYNMVMVVVILNILTSIYMGFNQTSLKKILFSSSLLQMSWMMLALMTNPTVMFILLMFYSLYFMGSLHLLLWNNNTSHSLESVNLIYKICMLIGFLLISGMPPMYSFILKLFMLKFMTPMFTIQVIILMTSTIITVSIYLNIFKYLMTFYSKTSPTLFITLPNLSIYALVMALPFMILMI